MEQVKMSHYFHILLYASVAMTRWKGTKKRKEATGWRWQRIFFFGHRIRQSQCFSYPLTAERFHTRMRYTERHG